MATATLGVAVGGTLLILVGVPLFLIIWLISVVISLKKTAVTPKTPLFPGPPDGTGKKLFSCVKALNLDFICCFSHCYVMSLMESREIVANRSGCLPPSQPASPSAAMPLR